MAWNIIFIVIFAIFFLIFKKSIKRAILSIFGGSVELSEMAGVVFLVLFTYMIIKEGNREHEWHLYNELYIFFTAGAAMTGLGLQHVLEVIKDTRSISSTKTKIETETEAIENESGEPK